jgi:hypothetical protein
MSSTASVQTLGWAPKEARRKRPAETIELALAEAQPLETSDADMQTHGLKLIMGGRA